MDSYHPSQFVEKDERNQALRQTRLSAAQRRPGTFAPPLGMVPRVPPCAACKSGPPFLAHGPHAPFVVGMALLQRHQIVLNDGGLPTFLRLSEAVQTAAHEQTVEMQRKLHTTGALIEAFAADIRWSAS